MIFETERLILRPWTDADKHLGILKDGQATLDDLDD